MLVKELISILQAMPLDAQVMVPCAHDFDTPVVAVKTQMFEQQLQATCVGRYVLDNGFLDAHHGDPIDCVLITPEDLHVFNQ